MVVPKRKKFTLKNKFHKKAATVLAKIVPEGSPEAGGYSIDARQERTAREKTCEGGDGCKCSLSTDGYYVIPQEGGGLLFLTQEQVFDG